MSDGRSPAPGVLGNKRNPPGSRGNGGPILKDPASLKDLAILTGWIAALLFAAGLCWFLTQPLRSRLLQNAANRALEQSGDSRRLEAETAGSYGLGSWYRVTGFSPESANSPREVLPEGTKAFVFAFIGGGGFFPCAAVVNPLGKVEEFIPIGRRGQQAIRRVSPALLGVYARRIEEGAGS